MFHKIKKLSILSNTELLLEFQNGITKKYSFKNLINNNSNFENLANQTLFTMVKVDTGGYGISWDDNTDISSEELWANGKVVL